MGQFSASGASVVIKEVVAAAFSSGAVKLIGPVNPAHAEANAKADALYLSTLINSVYVQLKGSTSNE